MAKEEYTIHILKRIVLDGFLFCGLILVIIVTDQIWMPFQRGFFCGDETLMFPYKDDTVTVLMLRTVGMCLPLLGYIICEWSILRKEAPKHSCFGVKIPTWIQGVYYVTASFFLGYCFVEITTNIAKNVIGRPRPHFFDVCRPSVNCTLEEWRDRYIQSSDYTCTGPMTHKFQDMRRSFLSGHSAMASYTMIYFALYLEKRVSFRGTRVIRHTIQFLVIMLSWFTALSRVSDFKHHWSDVLAGYTLGATMAIITFNWCTDLISKKVKHSVLPQHDVVYIPNQQVVTHS